MSKSKKTVVEWLSGLLGASHKTISENLTAEEYNQLVLDAGKFRASEEAKQDDDDANEPDDDDDDIITPDPVDATFEARITALESGFATAKNALKVEKRANKDLSIKLSAAESKVTETENKLAASEEQKKKLRNAVNPLGEQDISNQDGGNVGLTQADIDARASFKANRSEE